MQNGYTVSIPLNDNQSYDLIVDDKKEVKRVQVKTTKFKPKKCNKYVVQLKSVRSNKKVNKINRFDSSSCELVFIVTEDRSIYLIPSADLNNKTSLMLGKLAEKWKLQSHSVMVWHI